MSKVLQHNDLVAGYEQWNLLVQEAGGRGPLLFIVECDAIIAAVFAAHAVHVQPPSLGVVLVDLGAAHLQLQAGGQDVLHPLLHPVLAPVPTVSHAIRERKCLLWL